MELAKKHGVKHPETGIVQTPGVMWRREVLSDYVAPAGASQEEKTAAAFKKPASEDCILAHLIRLSTFLTIKGTSKDTSADDPQTMFLLADYTSRLFDEKVLEVDLFLACEHFIETEENGFFPTYARLLKQVQKVGK